MNSQDRFILDIGAMNRYGLDSAQVDEALVESNLSEIDCTLTEARKALIAYVENHKLNNIPRIDYD